MIGQHVLGQALVRLSYRCCLYRTDKRLSRPQPTTTAMIRTMRRYAGFAAELVAEAVSLVLQTPEALLKIAPGI
jgi:hypothetical protein